MTFNTALERVAVSGETSRSWFLWGLRALFAPVFNLVQVLFGVIVVVGIWRTLRRFVPAFDRFAARQTAQLLRLARRLRLWNVDSYGLVVLVCAFAVFLTILLTHSTLVSAVVSTASNMTVDQRFALSPEQRTFYYRYRWQLELLIWAGILASVRLVRMRRRERTPGSAALLTALLGVLILSVMMWAAPWRLVMQSDLPRMLFDGQRCYDLGREGSQLLLYCPDGPQPRVQRVSTSDVRLRDTGITESVFSTH